MRTMLHPCPSCRRHVRAGADRCPFCDGPLDAVERSADAPDTRGWKRAAIFTFGAAVSLTACSSTTTGSDAAAPDTAVADTSPADVARPDVASPDVPRDDGAADAPVDNGGVAPPYGITPPFDAGVPDDNGSFKADYGAPPPRDAGAE